jgi:hypothetical protein
MVARRRLTSCSVRDRNSTRPFPTFIPLEPDNEPLNEPLDEPPDKPPDEPPDEPPEARIVSSYGLCGKSQACRAIGRVGLHALAQPAGLRLCAQVNPTGPITRPSPTQGGFGPTHLEA